VLEDTETMIERLHLLKALGVRLAIDDFGTGYSSLSSLPKLPIDYIKIDKPFVDSIGGLKSSPLAFAITTLGQIFNLEVVAEGIERAEQVGGLRALGCEQGQGYYFSEPVDAAGISALLREPRGLVSRPPSGSWRTRTA
jgi:EAL domain-containing protein (putative c-di-GMP-specific phosphodiesterase class I)